MTVKRSCGDMHNGGYTGYTETCSACLRANNKPDYAALEAERDALAEALTMALEDKVGSQWRLLLDAPGCPWVMKAKAALSKLEERP